MSHRSIYLHAVFSTFQRQRTLDEAHVPALYDYIGGIFKKNGAQLFAIGGTDDHVHLLFSPNVDVPVSDFFRQLKQGTSFWLKRSGKFPFWSGWARGYFVASVSHSVVPAVEKYIRNQKEHHKTKSSKEELLAFLKELGITADERFV